LGIGSPVAVRTPLFSPHLSALDARDGRLESDIDLGDEALRWKMRKPRGTFVWASDGRSESTQFILNTLARSSLVVHS